MVLPPFRNDAISRLLEKSLIQGVQKRLDARHPKS